MTRSPLMTTHGRRVRRAAGCSLVITLLASGAASAAPPPSQAAATRGGATSARRAQNPDPRCGIGADLEYRAAPPTFTDTLTFPVNAETETIATTYMTKTASGFGADGGCHVWWRLSIGVGVENTASTSDMDVTASIPHPFFFNQPRVVNGPAEGIRHAVLATTLLVSWTEPLGTHLRVSIAAGPSAVRLAQDLVTNVEYDSAYPFDTATFTSAARARQRKSVAGANVSVTLTDMLTRTIGVEGRVEYLHASAAMTDASGQTLRVGAGGVAAGVGAVFRFGGRRRRPAQPQRR